MVRVEKRSPACRGNLRLYYRRWARGPHNKNGHYNCWRRPISLILVSWVTGTLIFHRAILHSFNKFGNPTLQEFLKDGTSLISIRSPGSSAILLLCDDCTKNDSTDSNNHLKYSWAYSLSIPSSFASAVGDLNIYTTIMNHLLSRLNSLEADFSHQWIGSFFLTSTFDSYLNLTLVDEMISNNIFVQDDVTVLAFANVTRSDESLQMRLDDTLPGMYDVLKYVLLQVGENPVDIASMELLAPGFKAFHGNYFVTQPELMLTYVEWLASVVQVIDSNSKVQSMIRSSRRRTLLRSIARIINPSYSSQKDLAPYYPPLDSMTDCLASYFFHIKGATIVTLSEYKRLRELEEGGRFERDIAVNFNKKTAQRLENSMNHSVIFVLAHNNYTAHKADHTFSNFSWAYPYILPRSYYFETYFYSHIMVDLMKSISINIDWVGSISWKADTKANITLLNTMVSDTSLIRDYDVLAFWNPDTNYTLWDQMRTAHPHLLSDLIEYTLLSLGENPRNIHMMRLKQPLFKTFYGSYFVTRPQHMRKYVQWISRVIHFLETDRKAQNMLWTDSKYNGDLKVARVVYNLPFYPLHAFLGERLVQYFFNSRGANIMTAEEFLKRRNVVL